MDTSEQPMAPSNKRANKRLKVGRACYTCRAKKIKCDGLRPCMQCKARQRPCSFYKDGFLETEQDSQTQQSDANEQLDLAATNLNINEQAGSLADVLNVQTATCSSAEPSTTLASNSLSPALKSSNRDESILFAETSTVNHNKLKRRGPLMESRISNTLSALGESMRKMTSVTNSRLAEKLLNSTDSSFGSFIMWMPEPSLPSRYSGSIEMPSREIQMSLIDQYFKERHESIGMLIKHYFYKQLETKGLLITPLLLNIIYAHTARFVKIPGCPKSEVFYHRARRLVDDFMDVPRVSTVVALCLLSLYEPSPEIYRPGSQHCRQWQYSGMACRMSIELGLYDDNNVHSSLSPVEIEFRRRVFWGCYDLDKFQSGGWERPWMISRQISRLLVPSVLPEESEDDAFILEVSNTKISFVHIFEEDLILLTASQAFVGGNHGNDIFLGVHKDNLAMGVSESRAKHQNWLRTLKPEMRWTPVGSISVKDVLELPAPRPMVAHLHLYYNTLSLGLLTKTPKDPVTLFQARVTAACMTQLAHHLCQTPAAIIKFDFIAHAFIHAIKVHIRYLDDPDVNLAQQAWLLFDRSIRGMQLLNQYAVIPNCMKFLQQVQNIYGLHMADGSTYSPPSSHSPTVKNEHRRAIPSSSIKQMQYKQKAGFSSSADAAQQHPSTPYRQASPRMNLMDNSNSNSNPSLDPTQFSDDISQILTGWTSDTPSATNERNSSIMQIDNNNNRSNNMIYANTSQNNAQLHSQYHSFNSPLPSRNPPHHLPQLPSFHPNPNSSSFSAASQHSQHQRSHSANQISTQSQQGSIWNTDARFANNSSHESLSYNSRDIIVPSQLNEDVNISSTNDSNSRAIFQQQQQKEVSNTDYQEESLWHQQHNNESPDNPARDGDTPASGGGLGIYMSSRQHYEEMLKRTPQ